MVRLIKIGATLVLLAGLGLCLFVNLVNAPQKGATDEANRSTGDEIVAALRAYEKRNGRYPEALEALVPDHLTQVPRLASGDQSFSYRVEASGRAFRLSYPEAPVGMLPSDAAWVFDSTAGAWEHVVY